MSHLNWRSCSPGALVSALVAVGGLSVAFAPSAALADDSDRTAAAINAAIAAQGTTPAASNTNVSIPSAGSGLVTLRGAGAGAAKVAIDLPARGVADKAGKTTVFDGTAAGAKIAVQPTADGVRALVLIDNANAPQRYRFPLRGDVARLEQQPDGNVHGYRADGRVLTQIAPAWARDAAGRSVPTHYEIHGTTLTQVVDHRGGNYAYGITADPLVTHWWGIGWKFSNSTSRALFNLAVIGAGGALTGELCSRLPDGALRGACSAIGEKLSDEAGKALARQALRDNRCLEAGVRTFLPAGAPYVLAVNC